MDVAAFLVILVLLAIFIARPLYRSGPGVEHPNDRQMR
jgi:hypothetical protein